jgi:hypothetical protein
MTTYQTSAHAGEAYDQDEVTLLASAARTASVTSDTLEIGDRAGVRLELVISAISGTGASVHVQIETRRDGNDAWRVVDAFPVQTATGTTRRAMSGCDRTVRAVCTIAGTTPSITFGLSGEAI